MTAFCAGKKVFLYWTLVFVMYEVILANLFRKKCLIIKRREKFGEKAKNNALTNRIFFRFTLTSRMVINFRRRKRNEKARNLFAVGMC